MLRQIRRLPLFLCAFGLAGGLLHSQAPTGELEGQVVDESGAAIPDVRLTVRNDAIGWRRSVVTTESGYFSVAVLPPGAYSVTAATEGFQAESKVVVVETGRTTRVDMVLRVEVVQQSVEAAETFPLLDNDSQTIDGVISRFQIENLPLNGREFLQLAVLQPGVVAIPNAGFFTSQFDVSILGAPPDQTRVTMDGSPTTSPIIGGTPQYFSQEVVQEFQLSSANFDLATGLTTAGAINVVTRSGGNDFHGSGFLFFRDHNMAAYPALRRDASNPDPFFARRQAGFHLGGPILRNRLFAFGTFEHNNQDGVATVQPTASGLTGFSGIFPADYTANQASARLDWRVNDWNTAFFRYSHDGNDGLSPPTTPGSLPSNWSKNDNWADQSVASLVTILKPSVINDFRVAYWYWHTRNSLPAETDCREACLGLGQPQVSILGANLVLGNHMVVPQGGDFRRYHLVDNLTWQKGEHQMRFGFEWRLDTGSGFSNFVDPAALVLYSPEAVHTYNAEVPPASQIVLPSKFTDFDDIVQLPLRSFSTGIGDPSIPPFGADDGLQSNIWRFHFQDSWRLTPELHVKYGLSYVYHGNLANHDLSKPAYLAPLLGEAGLAPTRSDKNNFGPSVGLAWSVTGDRRTVVRAGFGIYYALPLAFDRLQERFTIGPRGTGRFIVDGSLIPNPLPGIPGAPLFQPLDFPNGPTHFRGSHLLGLLPDIRSFLEGQFGDASDADLSIRNIEVFKQGAGILTRDFATPYSQHLTVGLQRELFPEMALSVDFVHKHNVHENMGNIDFNQWNSAGGPVIRPCSGLEILDVTAQCSSGAIGVQVSGGRSKYTGLLARVEKRYSRRFQFLASYALSHASGFNGVIDNNNWFASYGPLPTDRRHLLTVSGIADLPWGFRLSFISTVASRPPFTARLSGLDLDGDGTTSDILPGTTWNELNRGISERDLPAIVAGFNRDSAGGQTPGGQLIPKVVLPSAYQFGDTLASQDLRVSKIFNFSEGYSLTVLGEVFNLFNVVNLSGFNFNLLEPRSFGQPGSRITQVFGSGGPRAFQLGARFSF